MTERTSETGAGGEKVNRKADRRRERETKTERKK